MTRKLLLIIAIWLCVGAGCSFMAPLPDRTQYFILSPAVTGADVTPASLRSTPRLTLGVGPLRFPDYLKHPGVVTRASSNRLAVSDVNRWAEPLDRNFESVLSQNLSSMLGTQKIVYYPWYANTHVDYQVAVWVSRFETSDNGQAQLSALWTINNGQNGNALASGQTNAGVPVQAGEGGESAALSQALAHMSRQIVDRILELNSTQAS
jgi:uncharacterized lipoprotein YmbA